MRNLDENFKIAINRKTLIFLVIAVGIILRIVQYLYNKSLWLDESFVALNLMNRTFPELLEPLSFGQAAPLGFIFIEKAMTLIFGYSEYALRLFPLLSGIVSIFLFYRVSQRWLSNKAASVALILFVFSERLIYLSSEIKQYSSDVLISTLLLFVFIASIEKEKTNPSNLIIPGVVGALAIWFSFSSFFLLPGFGITLLLIYILNEKYYKLKQLLVIFFLWSSSFVLNFFVSLNSLRMNQELSEFFQYDFMPLPINSFHDIFWFFKAFYKFFSFTIGLPALRSILGWHSFTNGISISEFSMYSLSTRILLIVIALLVFNAGLIFFIGTYSFFLKSREKFFILISPFFISLFASGLGFYPFVGRTNAFLVPIAFIFIAEGVLFLKKKIKFKVINSVLIFLLLSYPLISAGYHLVKPHKVEEIRPVVGYINENWKKGDLLYIYSNSIPAFTYYYERKELEHFDIVYGERNGKKPVNWGKESRKIAGRDRVWFLISHDYQYATTSDRKNLLDYLDTRGIRVKSYEKVGASAYLYYFGE